MSGIAAAIGAGVAVLGTGFQISQSLRQGKMARDAQRASAESLAQAKQKLALNRLEGLQVPLDAYEQAGREVTAQQMQSLEGLREADSRTLASGVGKLSAAGAMATEKTRQQMADAIYDRDKMIADEQSRIDTALASVSLEEAKGYQKEAANREEASALALSGAIKGVGQAADIYQKSRDLYSQRQGELGIAKAYQEQGNYQGMNARQARRAMKQDGVDFAELLRQQQNATLFSSLGVKPVDVIPFSLGTTTTIDLGGLTQTATV